MKSPKMALVGELIFGDSPFSSNRPVLGPNIIVATNPVTPPTRWTAAAPERKIDEKKGINT